MTSRMPNDDNDDALRPMLGWDQALAVLQRNLMQQQQQQQQQSNHNPLNQAAVAALAAGLAPPTSLSNASLSLLWPYNLGSAGMIPPAAAAAASLASLGNPSNSYLNHLQQNNPHNPESLMALQQNILLLEQIQQQRQLLAANPHLLMALNAAQSSEGLGSPRSQLANSLANVTANNQHHHLQQQQQHHQLGSTNQQLPVNLLQAHRLASMNAGPKLSNNSASPNSSDSTSSNSGSSSSINHGNNNHVLNSNNSLLTTVNSLTNQHQDSLVDQHFRRSLGEDYNQIMSAKVDKINAGK